MPASSPDSDAPPPPTQAPPRTPSASPVSLEPSSYPHVFDSILSHLDIHDLISVGQVSSYLREKVQQRLAKHIVISPNNAHGPCLPTTPPRPFPKSNFWESDLTKFVRIVDYDRFIDPTGDYPPQLSTLQVDVVRAFENCFQDAPVPTTREWVSWQEEDASAIIPDTVTERVVIVLKGVAPLDPGHLAPASHLEADIIFAGDWWTIQHDARQLDVPCVFSPKAAKLWPDPDARCEICQEVYNSLARFMGYLAEVVATLVCDLSPPENVPITLVDSEDCLRVVSGTQSRKEAHKWFVDKAKTHMECVKDWREEFDAESRESASRELANRIGFMTRDEYRDAIGEETFKLHMEVGY